MPDIMDPDKRSEVMSKIRGKDTSPELALRRAVWALGCRYRVHDDGVAGIPDLSHRGASVAVFVDGCFWHGCPEHYSKPDTNRGFWEDKINRNKDRDREVERDLRAGGWEVLRFWEHEVEQEATACARQVKAVINQRRGD